MFSIRFGGVELTRADFDKSFRDYVAFSIAFAANTGCRDKEAALELLRYEADSLIEKSRADLLAACQTLLDRFIAVCADDNGIDPADQKRIDAARAAIQKAKQQPA
jgi:hypothetical protein